MFKWTCEGWRGLGAAALTQESASVTLCITVKATRPILSSSSRRDWTEILSFRHQSPSSVVTMLSVAPPERCGRGWGPSLALRRRPGIMSGDVDNPNEWVQPVRADLTHPHAEVKVHRLRPTHDLTKSHFFFSVLWLTLHYTSHSLPLGPNLLWWGGLLV